MDLLPLWWWQYSGIAISRSRCGCNWCCSVAATEGESMSTTETSPLIGPARGHGTRCRPKHLQPDQVSRVSSDIRRATVGAKLLWWCKTAIFFFYIYTKKTQKNNNKQTKTLAFPPLVDEAGLIATHAVCYWAAAGRKRMQIYSCTTIRATRAGYFCA